ncbi:hypothetical protein [Mesorhizobium erdmanii]|uniref:hypothetical protein n=1 Tax=Mesorhizobium erdmanii TaxID=1777866 RepID=UPI000B065F9C|nr:MULTISPECIES: hypothetical protein [Mesorhizobium]
MTSDIIEIWAGMLGLAYLAALGLYFEMLSARKRSHVAASHGFGGRIRPRAMESKHSR